MSTPYEGDCGCPSGLKRIFDKLGVRRQAELATLVSQLGGA